MAPDRRQRRRLDRKTEAGREAHGPQQPQVVLVEAGDGLADGPDDPRFEVGPAADIVDDLPRQWVEEHAVDCEIPPQRVVPGVGRRDLHRPATVQVRPVSAEGGDFDPPAASFHEHDAELCADLPGGPEERADLLRQGRGGDVEILRRLPEQQVAHAAARQQRLVAGGPELPDDLCGRLGGGGQVTRQWEDVVHCRA